MAQIQDGPKKATKVVKDSDRPDWMETLDFGVVETDKTITIQLMDGTGQDTEDDEIIGQLVCRVRKLMKHKMDRSLILKDRKGNPLKHVDMFLGVVDTSNHTRLNISVDRIKGEIYKSGDLAALGSFIEVQVGDTYKETKTVKERKDPKFQEMYAPFLLSLYSPVLPYERHGSDEGHNLLSMSTVDSWAHLVTLIHGKFLGSTLVSCL